MALSGRPLVLDLEDPIPNVERPEVFRPKAKSISALPLGVASPRLQIVSSCNGR
jgi:hypothetical protein